MRTGRTISAALLVLVLASTAAAEVRTRVVEYQQGDTVLQGLIAWKHSFTNPDADKAGMAALGYNADADRQSWAALLALLEQVFP